MSDYKNALIHLDKTIELDPKFENAYYNRALVKKELKISDYKTDFSKYDELVSQEKPSKK